MPRHDTHARFGLTIPREEQQRLRSSCALPQRQPLQVSHNHRFILIFMLNININILHTHNLTNTPISSTLIIPYMLPFARAPHTLLPHQPLTSSFSKQQKAHLIPLANPIHKTNVHSPTHKHYHHHLSLWITITIIAQQHYKLRSPATIMAASVAPTTLRLQL